MKPGDSSEARIRGYLYVLERSLRTFLPREVVADALREVESHIRDRAAQTEPLPDERTALERVLAELGPPLRVAQAYAAEMTVDQAMATGRLAAVARALWHVAATTVGGFFAVLGLFVGYSIGFSFLAIAVLKPIFPDNVGFICRDGRCFSIGAQFPLPPGAEVEGGYWIIPLALLVGMATLIVTHRIARRLLARWRRRHQADWRDGTQAVSGAPAPAETGKDANR